MINNIEAVRVLRHFLYLQTVEPELTIMVPLISIELNYESQVTNYLLKITHKKSDKRTKGILHEVDQK